MKSTQPQSEILCLTGARSLNKRMSLFIEGMLQMGAGVRVVALPRGRWTLERFENDSHQAKPAALQCRFDLSGQTQLTAVVCFHWVMLPIAVLIGTIRRVPVIYDEHDHYELNTLEGKRNSLRARCSQTAVRWFHRICLPWVSLVTCIHMCGSVLSRHLRRWQSNVIELNNYPVEAWSRTASSDDPGQPLCFIYMGGIFREKGVMQAVEAFLHIPETVRQHCRLHLFGHGDPQLIDELRQLGEISVHTSVTPEALRQFTSMNRCCGLVLYNEHPRYSLIGTNSRKLYEYLAMGLPVIVTRVGEIPTFIEKHDLGMVIGSRIDVDELQRSMTRLAESAELWKALSVNASTLMSDPTMSWESEWDKVLESGVFDSQRRAA